MEPLLETWKTSIVAFFGLLLLPHMGLAGEGGDGRRLFLLLYDQSAPFICEKTLNRQLNTALTALFDNELPDQGRHTATAKLREEAREGIPFFDRQRDELRCFYFGINEKNKRSMSSGMRGSDSDVYARFSQAHVEEVTAPWSAWRDRTADAEVAGYIRHFLDARKPWGNGYTLSQMAFPAVLTHLGEAYYEEIIIIVCSDFKAGSDFGNQKDYNVLRYSVMDASLANRIIVAQERVARSFFKIDFFSMAFSQSGSYCGKAGVQEHGILAYKLRPFAGSAGLDNARIGISTAVNLHQEDYDTPVFTLDEVRVQFEHNEHLRVDSVFVELRLGSERISRHLLAHRNGMRSLVDTELRLLSFDSLRRQYLLPAAEDLLLPALRDSRDSGLREPLRISYQFKAMYEASFLDIPLLYTATKTLDEENIYYATTTMNTLLYEVLPAALLLGMLFILYRRSKPYAIGYYLGGLSDQYEEIDYHEKGRQKHPFLPWTSATAALEVKCWLAYRKNPFRRRGAVVLSFRKAASGHESIGMRLRLSHKGELVYLAPGDDYRITGFDYRRKDPYVFAVELFQRGEYQVPATMADAGFVIDLHIDGPNPGGKEKAQLSYQFKIGPDKGDLWLGIDPGTTGTCIALGTQSHNLSMLKEGGKDRIYPSLVAFDLTEQVEETVSCTDWSKPLVQAGYGALSYLNNEHFIIFQSVKKLLGYRDKQEIPFRDQKPVSLSGQEITTLMVREILADVKTQIETNRAGYEDLLEGKPLLAQNGVVAIPNNFTAVNTQAMIDSIAASGDYKELRVIPEAEAVMVSYIFNLKELRGLPAEARGFAHERVLIFDMGGATINASVLEGKKVEKQEGSMYDVRVLSKLGYGIGGDTIDYCLIKILFEYAADYTELLEINPFEEPDGQDTARRLQIMRRRRAFLDVALRMKKELIKGFYEDKQAGAWPDDLLTTSTVGEILNSTALKELYQQETGSTLDIYVSHDDKLMELFRRNEEEGDEGRIYYPLFEHTQLQEVIYANVRTAVADCLRLMPSGVTGGIDTLILSGRSTRFPYISEVVKEELGSLVSADALTTIRLADDQLKSIVARGACLYGINRNSIHLRNEETRAHFGFKHTPEAGQLEFYNLVKSGTPLRAKNGEVPTAEAAVLMESAFRLDNQQVQFCQVMGVDPAAILNKRQKHKYSLLGKVKVYSRTKEIGMQVTARDEVLCRVVDTGGDAKDMKAITVDPEINQSNEEHYTWVLM